MQFFNMVCQYLEDLCNSVNQYFPDDQCRILQIIHELKIYGANTAKDFYLFIFKRLIPFRESE